jgi:glyoxylate reductase
MSSITPHRIYVTRLLPEEGMRALETAQIPYKVFHQPDAIPRTILKEHIKQAEALICLLTDTIDRTVIYEASRLKIISNYAVGFNNIDIEAATEKRIFVANTPGVLTEATADLAWALILAASRRIVEGDHICRNGEFKGWAPRLLLGKELDGATLGIAGMGRIGQAVLRRAVGFGMHCIYHSRSPKPDVEKQYPAERVSFEELITRSDILSIHVPLTDQTRGMFSEPVLRRMKRDAILINTARGELVDENALVQCLDSGGIGAAGLDVFEEEPAIHPSLLTLPNVVLAPHIGSATHTTRNKMAVMAVQHAVQGISGTPPTHWVNPF